MAVDRYLVGSDGNVEVTFGTNSQTFLRVQSYAANLTRLQFDQTGFGDTAKRTRLGMQNLAGTLACLVGQDTTATTTASTTMINILTSLQDSTATRPIVTLALWNGAGTSDTKIVSNCAFSAFAFNASPAGELTCTVNFETADGTAPVVTWIA